MIRFLDVFSSVFNKGSSDKGIFKGIFKVYLKVFIYNKIELEIYFLYERKKNE